MDPIIKKCGNCSFWHQTSDQAVGECFGNPPQVFITGAGHDALNRVAYNVEIMSPRLPRDRPPCRFHEPRFKPMDLTSLAAREPACNG